MSNRDELADIIQDAGEYIPGSHGEDYVNPCKAADAILDAGFRKPRTITSVEELDGLPEESVVRSADGYVYESQHLVDAPYPVEWHPCGVAESYKSHVIELPATVLYTPEPRP